MKRQFFLVLFLMLIVVAGFFPACNVDNSGGEEANILDSGPRYSITVSTEVFREKGLPAAMPQTIDTSGVVTVSPAGRVVAGTKVTLRVNTSLIGDSTADPSSNVGGGGGTPLTPGTIRTKTTGLLSL